MFNLHEHIMARRMTRTGRPKWGVLLGRKRLTTTLHGNFHQGSVRPQQRPD